MSKKIVIGFSILSLMATVSTTVTALANSTPNLADVVRRGTQGCPSFQAGSQEICNMNQGQADQYCRAHGLHLPSARELALALNPTGVSQARKDGFVEIRRPDADVDFYYSSKPFSAERLVGTPAAGGLSLQELKNHSFWSSSPYYWGTPSAYVFDGYDGSFDNYSVNNKDDLAVRCGS